MCTAPLVHCRGVVIGSNTNRARTQMTEGLLRALTRSRVYTVSGGVRRASSVLPAAVEVMREIGVDISNQTPSSLASVLGQLATYDAYVSIDAPSETKQGLEHDHRDHTYDQEMTNTMRDTPWSESTTGHSPLETPKYFDMLFPSTPSHWTAGSDAADVRERWQVWSPRNPMIFHERSTRKFQDHLYEGEPLFQTLHTDTKRQRIRLQERWEIVSVSHKYAMERSDDFKGRVRAVRNDIVEHCVRFLRRLEQQLDSCGDGRSQLLDEEVLAAIRRKVA